MTPSTVYTGSECVVACVVAKQPPWSTATSTATAPFFITPISSRVTSFGAAAPGISTAPTRRSARRQPSSSVIGFEATVLTRPRKMSSSSRIRSGEVSRIVTSAPIPEAILAAFVPTTPPPMITTSAGGTPGTPGRSTPRPPLDFCR